MSSHFVLATQNEKQRRLAYADVAPYAWWQQAYGLGAERPPKTVATHAHGWPIHTIELPALVVDEFIKIFNGIRTVTQAHARLPVRLDEDGYTMAQWQRCLVRYGFGQPGKQKRDEDEDEEPTGAVARPRKKQRKAEPVLNPMEEKARTIGTALGDLIRTSHPGAPAFLAGTEQNLHAEFIAAYKPSVAVLPYELDVPGLGTVSLVDYERALGTASRAIMLRAVADALHPRALVESSVYTSNCGSKGEMLPLVVSHWPAVEPGSPKMRYAPDTVLCLHLNIGYQAVDLLRAMRR
jgi:hypothetical protein